MQRVREKVRNIWNEQFPMYLFVFAYFRDVHAMMDQAFSGFGWWIENENSRTKDYRSNAKRISQKQLHSLTTRPCFARFNISTLYGSPNNISCSHFSFFSPHSDECVLSLCIVSIVFCQCALYITSMGYYHKYT